MGDAMGKGMRLARAGPAVINKCEPLCQTACHWDSFKSCGSLHNNITPKIAPFASRCVRARRSSKILMVPNSPS